MNRGRRQNRTRLLWTGAALAMLVAMLLGPQASPWMDGLERVAHDHGAAELEGRTAVEAPAPFPDYQTPAVDDPALSTALAGGAGTLATLLAALALGRALRGRTREP